MNSLQNGKNELVESNGYQEDVRESWPIWMIFGREPLYQYKSYLTSTKRKLGGCLSRNQYETPPYDWSILAVTHTGWTVQSGRVSMGGGSVINVATPSSLHGCSPRCLQGFNCFQSIKIYKIYVALSDPGYNKFSFILGQSPHAWKTTIHRKVVPTIYHTK